MLCLANDARLYEETVIPLVPILVLAGLAILLLITIIVLLVVWRKKRKKKRRK